MRCALPLVYLILLFGCAASDDRAQAEKIARQEIKNLLIGVQKVTGVQYVTNDSGICVHVNVTAEGVNKFGGPARETVLVRVWKIGKGKWLAEVHDDPKQFQLDPFANDVSRRMDEARKKL
jgi:hypothetical protein